MRLVLTVVLVLTGIGTLVAQRPNAFQDSPDHRAIGYSTRPVNDAVAQLNTKLATLATTLAFDPATGYLRSILAALDIPVESQTLVFSHTSAQADRIGFSNPRAVFFSDSTAVGWVRGSDVLEVAAQDPRQGVIFYTLEQKRSARPRLTRETTDCLTCHLSWDTLAVPGLQTMSTFPMSDDPHAYANGTVVDHRTPLFQRWGGWYVTAKTDAFRHLGNLPVVRPAAELAKAAPPTPHFTTLAGRFDTSAYLSNYSDIAALMVLNHQTHMTNLLTRLGWETRVAEYERRPLDRVRDGAKDLVDYMLFVDEAPIGRKVEGSSGFAEKFAARGPRDGKGRSLRQLDLESRLLRYPCSYMIYSEAFEALEPVAKDAVYQRLWQVLSGQDSDKRYTRLSLADRQAIVDILRDTKKNLPDYFRAAAR